MRTIGALPVALTDMPWRVFTALNFASAITWTFVMVGVGYVSGVALDEIIGDNWGVFSVALLSLFFLLTYIAWRQVKSVALEQAK
jgi:membrane protein DedA with SNARE-associated domain